MVLRSLEMQGFKSFPDKTELKFGRGITAVVGPNGSGKSNISDAVRWVLGEQRTKSLRGSKMEDVIFGGTSKRKALGFAQVTLTLDNSDKTLKDRGELVSVTRRYYRSGESEYKIDGELVRRRDVRELFMDTGLGSDGYSLVGQGKIDSLISAKNEERRELFEEAAGISRFRHKRTDAMRRLEQAQENMVRLLDIMKELEDRVGPLKLQSEKAAKFLELAGEKRELEIGIWLNKINRFTQELREQERKIESAGVSYELAEKELSAIEKEMEEILSETGELSAAIDEIRRNAGSFEEEALRHDGEVQVLEATILHNNETIERITREMQNASDENSSIENQIEEKNSLIREKNSFIEAKREELKQQSFSVETIQNENSAFNQQAVELSREISTLTVQLSDYRVKSSQALSSIEEINARQGNVEEAIAKREQEKKFIASQKEENEKNLAFLQERIDEYTNAMNGYQLRVKQRGDRAQSVKNECDKLFSELSHKQQKARMLRDLEKNMEGYTGAVKMVMKQAGTHALSGILGPVSQLISVDNAFSTAIETALGAAMQNIVTETEADAKRAIYFLKSNKAGRATFLPVSAIRGRRLEEKGLEDNLGFVDLAVNLVKTEKKYEQILSSLLGKTVVCEDMDSAIGIAKRYSYRFRIVTLDGQLINAGGSMTGGSRTQNAGILSRGTLIEELEEEAKKLSIEFEKKKEILKTAQEEVSAANADLQGAGADLANANEDKIRAEGDLKVVLGQWNAVNESLSALQSEKENAEGRIQLFSHAHRNAEKEIEAISAQIKSCDEALEKTTSSSEQLMKKREEANAVISSINLEIVTAANDCENAKAAIAELEQRKVSHKGRLGSIQAEIEAIRQKNETLSHSILEIREAAATLREKAKLSAGEIERTNERRNAFEKRSGELRLLERAKTVEREKLSTELGRLEERKNNMRKEYDEIINKLYDEYQLTRREAEEAGIEIHDLSQAVRRLGELKSAIRSLGSVNVGAIEEYKEVSERYEFLKSQIEDIEKSRDELVKIIEELTSSMSHQFKTQFDKINTEFQHSFAEFFGGGNGALSLEDPANVLESPIEIKIQPPGKSVQNINLFSGGEKSLAAMALLFSILKVTPAPFCIYDEVEAALDDVNVDRFAKYMRKMTDKVQFISITHRRGTMEEADVLYGVTMQEKGVSKLLELKTTDIAEQLGI